MVKITEYAENLYVVEDGEVIEKFKKKERKMFSKMLVNNLVVAYMRSHLALFLRAPIESNDIEMWQN